MADERTLDLVLRLRSEKNNAEGKKITNELQKIYQSASKVVKSINEGFDSTTKTTRQAQKALESVLKTLLNLEGVAAKQEKVNSTTKETLKLYTNLTKVTKQVTTITKQLARGMIDESDSADKAASSTKRVQENLEKISNIKAINELVSQAEHLSANLSEASKEAKYLYNEQEKLAKKRASYEKNIAELKALANVYFNTSNETKKLIRVSSELENSLRKIQTLTEFKEIGNFERGVQSSKLFLKELDILAVKLKEIKGENLGVTIGISAKMITDVRRISNEVNALHGGVTSMNKAFSQMKEANSAFNQIAKSLGLVDLKINNVINGTAELQGKSKDSLTKISSEYDVLAKKIQAIYKQLTGKETIATSLSGLATAIKRVTEKVGGSYKELQNIQSQAIKNMEKNVIAYAQTDFKKWSEAALTQQSYIDVLHKTEGTMIQLTTAYGKFKAANEMMGRGTLSLAEAQKYANEVMAQTSAILAVPGHKLTDLAIKARLAVKELMNFATTAEYTDSVSDDLAASIARLVAEEKQLSIAGKALGNSHIILGKQVENARAQLNEYVNTVRILSERMAVAKRGTEGAEANFDLLSKKLAEVATKARVAQDKLDGLTTKLQQAEHKAGDANRAMSRLSAEGFANMIVSQAAWMAGFVLIFGSLDRLKVAFSQVTETQTAVARAMRTIRDETKTAAEMQDYLTDAVDRMRMKLGSSAEDVGEALYQLGSAGLKLDESLAALDSTMDNIVGTEADMENITNLVAGLYNNFGDQIVKLDGSVRTISNTFDGYNNQLVESASLTEKFQRINDLLVRTFDAHQAEMIQIRDGLKFMAQSAKAANLSLEQQLGILATLHDHLIKAGAAGRGMRVILSRIAKEAPKWKEAFNIDIDMSKPLDFMAILKQMNAQMEKNAWTVNDLNKIFTRFGLRGAEPMIVLIKYFKELNENTLDLIENSSNAAENMRKIRLDNLADQAKIANAAIDVLLKNALAPLSDMFSELIVVFNSVVSVIKSFNDMVGGSLGTLMKIGVQIGILVALGLTLKNLGSIIGWIGRVFGSLATSVRDFGRNADESKEKTEKLKKEVVSTNQSLKNAKTVYGEVYTSQQKFNQNLVGMSSRMSKVTAGITAMKAAIAELSSVIKFVALAAVVTVLIKLITYSMRWEERLRDEIKALQGQAVHIKESIDAFDRLKGKLEDVSEDSDNWRKELNSISGILLINIEETDNYSESIEKLSVRLEEYQAIQEKALDAKKFQIMRKELELMKFQMKKVVDQTGFWENLMNTFNPGLAYKKSVDELKKSSEFINDMFKGTAFNIEKRFVEISNKVAITTSTIEKLTKALETPRLPPDLANDLEKQKKIFEEELPLLVRRAEKLSKMRDEINSVVKVTESSNKAIESESRSIKQKIDLGEKLTLSIRELIENYDDLKDREYEITKEMEKQIKAANKLRKDRDSLNNSIEKNTDSLKKNEDALASSSKTFDEYISVMEGVRSDTEDSSNSFANLQISIARSSGALEHLNKTQGIAKFSGELKSLSARLNNLSSSSSQKIFDKLLQETVKLSEDGVKHLQSLEDQIDKLNIKILSIEKIKLDIDISILNRNVDAASKKADILKERFDRVAESASSGSYKYAVASIKYNDAIKNVIKEIDKAILAHEKEANIASESYNKIKKAAEDSGLSIEQRNKLLEEALIELSKEKKFYDDILTNLEKKYKSEKDLISANKAAKKISAEEEERRLKKIEQEYLTKYGNVIKKLNDVDTKTKEVQTSLGMSAKKEIESLEVIIANLKTSIEEVRYLAASGISLNYQSISDAIREAQKLNEKLGKKIDKKVTVTVTGDKEALKNRGGLIQKFASGGMVPVRVTHGEGYIPPEEASKHMAALSRLNSGGTTSAVPQAIGTFSGTKGIDRISTFLPAGSYVLSQKGMEAYKRSVDNGAQKLQTGGEVKEIESSASQSSPVLEKENYGSITIVVEKGGRNKEFPVYGQPSVLRELRKELEEERLTRLN